jgi:hypothetical protein
VRTQVISAIVFAIVLAAFVVSGCGSGDAPDPNASTLPAKTSTGTAESSVADLERQARTALDANAQLSGYVLWHNALPRSARYSTQGPALTELRRSAATRRSRGIRVRMVTPRFEVRSIRIDPSFARATASVRYRDVVRPYRRGRAMGRAIHLDERTSIELRRVGEPSRFVVWTVSEVSEQ